MGAARWSDSPEPAISRLFGTLGSARLRLTLRLFDDEDELPDESEKWNARL